ncbi:hypothetical protein M413DRAFT_74181 [Hebeloma cylindrosporum]|uniref:Calcineurin-like phosphoesterase domain-containing protein n=1 Tax=Hebeloma cylindrosporum TaxID=76867 RepID=A0A0C2YFI7_HEBCY|nr:hypothetical protein M413DRAFT_74181 [Hebeloma cylindrosporum h7]
MYQPRQILAYGTLSVFILFVLFYGVTDSVLHNMRVAIPEPTISTLPDLSHYEPLKVLAPDDFPLDDSTRRIIIVGDIHGMMKPFEELLKRVEYSPREDVLIHVGDIITKGPHTGSLAVLDYMATHNVTGVRGNHDQQVIEWRGWLDWISSISGGKAWLKRLERRWEKVQEEHKDFNSVSWVETEGAACSRVDKEWCRRIPKGWVLFSDHHKIAKDMSESQFRYLLRLPLRLYIPSAHAYVVHAGLLSSDPRYSAEDVKKQPLAHVPSLPQRPTVHETGGDGVKSNETVESLRNLQEISLLTQIPQNTDPWVVLNMRSIVGRKISRKSKGGVPWTEIWNQHMNSCLGFNQTLANDATGHADVSTTGGNMHKLHLSCYPSTTIYGHAASRGLVVKRWSFGLDSGCVYRRKLSALVIGKSSKASWNQGGEIEGSNNTVTDDDGDVDISMQKNYESLPFGDRGVASIIRVKCS